MVRKKKTGAAKAESGLESEPVVTQDSSAKANGSSGLHAAVMGSSSATAASSTGADSSISIRASGSAPQQEKAVSVVPVMDAKDTYLVTLVKQVKDEVYQLRVETAALQSPSLLKLSIAAVGGICLGAAVASVLCLRFGRSRSA